MKLTVRTKKAVAYVLIALSVLAALKLIFTDYTLDEEYQLVMAYRNLHGDAVFGQMWEPHQTSAFFCIGILFFYKLITGSFTGAVVAVRVVTTLIQAGLSVWLYALAAGIVTALFCLLTEKRKLLVTAVAAVGTIGLCLLVAIPLPGTGAWTGALVAALMNMRIKRALPTIFVGVLIAAVAVTLIMTLGIHALDFLI